MRVRWISLKNCTACPKGSLQRVWCGSILLNLFELHCFKTVWCGSTLLFCSGCAVMWRGSEELNHTKLLQIIIVRSVLQRGSPNHIELLQNTVLFRLCSSSKTFGRVEPHRSLANYRLLKLCSTSKRFQKSRTTPNSCKTPFCSGWRDG